MKIWRNKFCWNKSKIYAKKTII